jgi:hypothetical protein
MDEGLAAVLGEIRAELTQLRLTVEQLVEAIDPDCYLDVEGGETRCSNCRGIVRVVPHVGATPTVVDRDRRRHRCQRQIAATFYRYGAAEMLPLLEAAAAAPPVPESRGPARPAPGSAARPPATLHGVELPDL